MKWGIPYESCVMEGFMRMSGVWVEGGICVRFVEWCEKAGTGIKKMDSEFDGLKVEVEEWRRKVLKISRGLGSLLAKPDYGELWRESVRGYWEGLKEVREEIRGRAKELGLAWDELSKSWGNMSGIDWEEDEDSGGFVEVLGGYGKVVVDQIGLVGKMVTVLTEMTKVYGYIEGVGDCAEGWIDERKVLDDMKMALKEMEKGVKNVSGNKKSKVYGEGMEVV